MTTTMGSIWQSDGWNVARHNALLVLSRDRALVLTAQAALELGRQFRLWARDPDIYAVLLDASVAGLGVMDIDDSAGPAVADLAWRLECFSKPTVTLFDGYAGDVGWALALAGTHRCIGRNFRYRSVAAAHGRLPPGNIIAALACLGEPRALETVLGAHVLGRPQAIAAAFASHAIDARAFEEIIAGLADADPVDPLLDARHEVSGEAVAPVHVVRSPAAAAKGTIHAARSALASVMGQPIDRALSIGARWDDALRRCGSDASPPDLDAAFTALTLELPARRTLQAFRTA